MPRIRARIDGNKGQGEETSRRKSMETNAEVVEKTSQIQDGQDVLEELHGDAEGMGREELWIPNGTKKPFGTVTKGGGDWEYPGPPPTEECDNSPQKKSTDETRRMVQCLSVAVSPLQMRRKWIWRIGSEWKSATTTF